MSEQFYYIAAEAERILLREQPKTVLEISMSGSRYGRLIGDCQRRTFGADETLRIDRVDVSDSVIPLDSRPYSEVLPLESLDHPECFNNYDLIFIADLFEFLDGQTGWRLLDILSEKINKQILVFSREDPNVVFGRIGEELSKLNFTWRKIDSLPDEIWMYVILPIKIKERAGGLNAG